MGRDKNSFIAANRLDGEEKLLVSRIGDMLSICERSFAPGFSGFLSEGELALAEKFLSYMCAEGYELFGGYEGAMRCILCIYPEYMQPEHEAFPLRTVRFDSRGAASLTHRDYLGSLMALGINRSQTGDILCDDSGAYAVLSPAAAEMAVYNITKIGRVGVKTRYADGEALSREDKFSEITATVASLRLDCVISAALRVSREKAAALIRSGSVSVNHGITESVSENVAEGSILSVRGSGRFILSEIGGTTKKDRLHITIKKYI
ncbi:MAG: RNA-binding protein [Huintestinicola sp.]|uniref:YlmH family RNA-binding protein n=1 Tax=Huintestinicola sp. TaxID=2981661 RepID=UPI003F01490F